MVIFLHFRQQEMDRPNFTTHNATTQCDIFHPILANSAFNIFLAYPLSFALLPHPPFNFDLPSCNVPL